jgi:RimJ/RimL family protein N-acetyltransferase
MPFLPDDIDATYEWFDDPAYWRGSELKPLDDYAKTMTHRAEGGNWTIWSVMTRGSAEAWESGQGSRELIGHASSSDFRFGRLSRNSYAYLIPEARGKGYGREMISLRSSYAFDYLAMEMVETTTMRENVAAQRALESVGYECTGTIVRDDFFDGRWHDALIYVLFRERFREPIAERKDHHDTDKQRRPILTRS